MPNYKEQRDRDKKADFEPNASQADLSQYALSPPPLQFSRKDVENEDDKDSDDDGQSGKISSSGATPPPPFSLDAGNGNDSSDESNFPKYDVRIAPGCTETAKTSSAS